MTRETIAGWGNYPRLEARVRRARHRGDLSRFARERPAAIAAGSRRSYGDACLFSNVVSTVDLDHLLDFEQRTGVLRAEAGVTIEQIIRFALPLGWFPPVTPGTKFPTLGGCIAADVHGKNHHVDGSLGNFVDEIEMVLADGTAVRCSPQHREGLFRATVGGMGLTGFICAATLRLRRVPSAFVAVRSEKAGNLRQALRLLAETQDSFTYSVAWIDCLARGRARGRSVLMLGNHAGDDGLPRRSDCWRQHSDRRFDLPLHLPEILLNPISMRLFNSLYYYCQRRGSETVQHYNPYFYPLDAVGNWNRVYGRRGFLQYQFVVPYAGGEEILDEILDRTARRGSGSFLAVLKTFGSGRGLLSFPEPGYTLALDFPLSDRTIVSFLQEISALVREAGGRVYLAKDAVLERDDFEAMYPDLEEFKRIKRFYDPDNHFRSAQSDRLGIR